MSLPNVFAMQASRSPTCGSQGLRRVTSRTRVLRWMPSGTWVSRQRTLQMQAFQRRNLMRCNFRRVICIASSAKQKKQIDKRSWRRLDNNTSHLFRRLSRRTVGGMCFWADIAKADCGMQRYVMAGKS